MANQVKKPLIPTPKPLTSPATEMKTNTDNIIQTKSAIEQYFNTSENIKISKDVFRVKNDLINLRRYFHANPELSFKEINTSKNIIKYLTALKLKVNNNIATTGVTSVIHGLHNGPTIMLRADMDGLPINEENNIGYKSKNNNVMHACGHDAHMAILLTVARILTEPKYIQNMYGSVKLCFQPAEELGAGAKKMVDEGVLENDDVLKCGKVEQVYGLHVWSYEKVGKCVVKQGSLMAGSCKFYIEIEGIGGHGAEPQGTCDTVIAGTQLVIQLHSIVSRNISPLDEGVITIGTLNIGTNYNIIAETGTLSGTIRYMSMDIFNIFKKRINSIVNGIMISYDVKIKLKYSDIPYPPLINSSKQCYTNIYNACQQTIPDGIITTKSTMAAEDFSFYLNKIPGCFFFIGCGTHYNKNKENNNNINDDDDNHIVAHHKSTFNINEKSLIIGVQILINLVMNVLSKPIIKENKIDVNKKNDKVKIVKNDEKVVNKDKSDDVKVDDDDGKDSKNDKLKKDVNKDVVGNGIIDKQAKKD